MKRHIQFGVFLPERRFVKFNKHLNNNFLFLFIIIDIIVGIFTTYI